MTARADGMCELVDARCPHEGSSMVCDCFVSYTGVAIPRDSGTAAVWYNTCVWADNAGASGSDNRISRGQFAPTMTRICPDERATIVGANCFKEWRE